MRIELNADLQDRVLKELSEYVMRLRIVLLDEENPAIETELRLLSDKIKKLEADLTDAFNTQIKEMDDYADKEEKKVTDVSQS